MSENDVREILKNFKDLEDYEQKLYDLDISLDKFSLYYGNILNLLNPDLMMEISWYLYDRSKSSPRISIENKESNETIIFYIYTDDDFIEYLKKIELIKE